MIFRIGYRNFYIDEELLSRYKESLLTKCAEHATGDDEILVDRDPKYFESWVLKYMEKPESIGFHRMSNILLEILLEEAKFYGIDDMVENCKGELNLCGYGRVDTILSSDDFRRIMENEGRYVILFRESELNPDSVSQLSNALPFADRNKCLFLGFVGSAYYGFKCKDYSSTILYRRGTTLAEFSGSNAFYFCVQVANLDIPEMLKLYPGE